MGRLQKERDGFQEESEKLQERLEVQQSQLTKAQRDRENMHTEMEVFRERWEKAQQNQQKLQVSLSMAHYCRPDIPAYSLVKQKTLEPVYLLVTPHYTQYAKNESIISFYPIKFKLVPLAL